MIRPILGLMIGAVVGMLAGGALGGTLGAIVGIGLGMLWYTNSSNTLPIPAGSVPDRVKQNIMCLTRGETADCTFLRDENTGQWLDVEKCSLYADGHPKCTKRCLRLMRDINGSSPASVKTPAAAAH